jgi:hypothetical protein
LRALELDVFFFGAPAPDHGAHVGHQLLVVPGLLDEIGGPRLHGGHGVFHRAVGGNHDHAQLGIAIADVAQDLQPVAVGQREIEQHQVHGLVGHLGQAFFAGGGGLHRKAFQLEQRLQRLADGGFIIDDQNCALRGRVLVHGAPAGNDGGLAQALTAFLISGNSRWNVVPLPIRLSTRILPACSWMIP